MKRIKFLFLLAIVGLVFLNIETSYARFETNSKGELVEVTENGTINWSSKKVEAQGSAEADQSLFKQKVSAEVRARANLLKVLDGVQIKSERIVRDGRLKGEISTEKVEGFLKHSRVSEPGKNSLGLLEVTAYVYLDENSNSVLLPSVYFKGPSDSQKQSDQPLNAKPVSYTGLIVDAGGLSVRPALMPKFFDESGLQEIYRPRSMDREFIIKNGYCGYAGSLVKAKKVVDRVGHEPLVVKAAGVSENGIDFFIKKEDVAKMLSAEEKNGILRNGRIMIVVDVSDMNKEE